jgi:uncharacterized membrane protein
MGRALALKGWAFGAVVFLLACAPPWVGLYGPKGVGDMYLFRLYGHRMQIYHRWPYHDFFFDWAPGLVPPVLFPTWLPGDYYHAFHVLDALYALLALGAVAWTLVLLGAGTSRLFLGVGAAAVAPFALGSISIDSLDYWPALFTAAGLAVFLAGRYRIAAGLIGFAVVAKVYALVLAPLLLVWLWRRRGRDEAVRCTAIGTAVVVLVSLPFLIVGPTGLGFSIKSQFVRGLQMESLGASILMALDHLGLYRAHVVVGTPYSLDIAGGVARAVGVLFTLVTVAVLLWIYVRYLRGPDERQRLVTACAAALTAYVAFSRVLSPQYILWLVLVIPFLTGAAGVAAEALLLAACAVTMTWFPGRFVHLQHISPVSWFVLVRNVLLVLVFAATAWPLLRRHEPQAGSTEQIRHEQVPQG